MPRPSSIFPVTPDESESSENGYRLARAFPPQLLDHVTVVLEEQLHSEAFSLLLNALTSGTGASSTVYVPPAQHLALAATLIVHPQLTTRTTSPDKHAAANDALKYLQHVNKLVGPCNAGLDRAFQFSNEDAPSRGKRAKSRRSDVTSEPEADPSAIRSPYVGKQSLWNNADDFWSIVGWAFNCSVAHPLRWERWKVWLHLMLDVLEDDLEIRLPSASAIYESGGATAVREYLKDSMLAEYLSPIGEGRNNKRRLMRAIFADGKQKSLAEFGEVWRHETKPPKQKSDDPPTKRRKLDLENGEFGDYFDDDSDGESPDTTARRSRSVTAFSNAQKSSVPSAAASEDDFDSDEEPDGTISPNGSTSAPGIELLGGMDAIAMRQRILTLLTRFCAMNPDAFLDNEDLFDIYTEFLRHLPLPIFQQFVLPTKPYFPGVSQGCLNQMLLRPLLAATAPPYKDTAITQAEFETHYAPYAANRTSVVDNAKVSLLVESLLRLLWSLGTLDSSPQLRRLIEQGTKARKYKANFDGRKKVGSKVKIDEQAFATMEASATRMMMILDMAE